MTRRSLTLISWFAFAFLLASDTHVSTACATDCGFSVQLLELELLDLEIEEGGSEEEIESERARLGETATLEGDSTGFKDHETVTWQSEGSDPTGMRLVVRRKP